MAEFDRIAPVYDETRGPISASALHALRTALERTGSRTLLEVGVGTGRVSDPLRQLGWTVTGIDLSMGMLRAARAKGLPRLLRGDAERQPFRNGSFDASILAHVLHVFRDPSAVLRETARVTQGRVFALLFSPSDSTRAGGGIRQARGLFREVRERYGLPPPPRPREWWREAALIRAVPPLEIHEFSGDAPGRSIDAWIDGIEKRAYSDVADLPDDALREIVTELRERSRTWPAPGPRVERLAEWAPDQLRDVAALVRPEANP
jgi:SAM-dependent methyltransferase